VIRSPKTGPFKARVFRDIFPALEERKTMKASQFSDAQKAFILKRGTTVFRLLTSAGRPASARRPISIGRKNTMACSRRRLRRLKQPEDENSRLKKIVADLLLDREMLQDVIRRKI
jgi:putative transposase